MASRPRPRRERQQIDYSTLEAEESNASDSEAFIPDTAESDDSDNSTPVVNPKERTKNPSPIDVQKMSLVDDVEEEEATDMPDWSESSEGRRTRPKTKREPSVAMGSIDWSKSSNRVRPKPRKAKSTAPFTLPRELCKKVPEKQLGIIFANAARQAGMSRHVHRPKTDDIDFADVYVDGRAPYCMPAVSRAPKGCKQWECVRFEANSWRVPSTVPNNGLTVALGIAGQLWREMIMDTSVRNNVSAVHELYMKLPAAHQKLLDNWVVVPFKNLSEEESEELQNELFDLLLVYQYGRRNANVWADVGREMNSFTPHALYGEFYAVKKSYDLRYWTQNELDIIWETFKKDRRSEQIYDELHDVLQGRSRRSIMRMLEYLVHCENMKKRTMRMTEARFTIAPMDKPDYLLTEMEIREFLYLIEHFGDWEEVSKHMNKSVESLKAAYVMQALNFLESPSWTQEMQRKLIADETQFKGDWVSIAARQEPIRTPTTCKLHFNFLKRLMTAVIEKPTLKDAGAFPSKRHKATVEPGKDTKSKEVEPAKDKENMEVEPVQPYDAKKDKKSRFYEGLRERDENTHMDLNPPHRAHRYRKSDRDNHAEDYDPSRRGYKPDKRAKKVIDMAYAKYKEDDMARMWIGAESVVEKVLQLTVYSENPTNEEILIRNFIEVNTNGRNRNGLRRCKTIGDKLLHFTRIEMGTQEMKGKTALFSVKPSGALLALRKHLLAQRLLFNPEILPDEREIYNSAPKF